MAKVTQDEKVKALWTDVLRLLNAEQQANVARFDAWLQRIEDQLEAGGDTVKLIDVGLKVTDRRSRELKLDARTVPPPAWDPDLEADMEALGVKLRPEVPDPQA